MSPPRRSDVEAALWSGWLLTGWPMGSAAVIVWLLRTLPTHGPHRLGLPVVALAAVGVALVVLALPVAARLLLVGLLWMIGRLVTRLHRQAVAFKVADIAIELEGMRLVTLRAAARAEQGKDFSREAALARKLTSEYGMRIGTDGVQLLGGHGYVKEHPVERWYRDLRAIGVMEGAVLV